MKRTSIGFALAAAVMLCACGSAKEDWNKANATNTIAAYQDYLSKHPTGEHSGEASDRIRSLQDEEAWSQAKQMDSIESYRDYLQKQPTGVHTKDARDAVTAHQRGADWKTAETAGTPEAIQDFLKKYPDGTEADQARAKLAELQGYKVHLASGKTEKQAHRTRDELSSKYGNVLHDVVVVPASSGKGFGVESAPMTQSQADAACSELKKAHLSCQVVKRETGQS